MADLFLIQATFKIAHCMISQHPMQALRIELTSEEDLFFMHVLEVTEEDFLTLKADQGILVDFLGFPEKVAGLLERCLKSRKDVSHRQAFQQTSKSLGPVPEGSRASRLYHCKECTTYVKTWSLRVLSGKNAAWLRFERLAPKHARRAAVIDVC